MVLVVGGVGQGKLDYVLTRTGLAASQVCSAPEEDGAVVNHLESWVRRTLAQGRDPWGELEPILQARPERIFLCDEVGCGVVPMDREERTWREAVGRLCCRLAGEAEAVVRLYCGLPTVLKGEEPWS